MRLSDFFQERVDRGVPLVLVTVFETAGSTYSKAGGQMLIDGDGKFCGMLSGGCLEGDLVARARDVIKHRSAQTASYDLGADDELWGLGVGCDGTMRVLLQPLFPDQGYQPFAAILDIINGGARADFAVVVDAESANVKAGASLLLYADTLDVYGMDAAVADSIARDVENATADEMRQVLTPAGPGSVLFVSIEASPSLLVLGAGPDAEPVIRIASELGWRCTVADHRPAYIESRSLPAGASSLCCPADQVASRLLLGDFDMVLVMSHHLASDRAYLRQLAATDIAYIGLLGPGGRRDRLLRELSDVAPDLQGRLHGPAGIVLGGRGPGPIALSIVAEMQQYLQQRR